MAGLTLAGCNGDYDDWASPQSYSQESAAAKYGVSFAAGPEANDNADDADGMVSLVLISSPDTTVAEYSLNSLTINGSPITGTIDDDTAKVDALQLEQLVCQQQNSRASVIQDDAANGATKSGEARPSLTQPPRYLVERKAFRARDGLALIAMAGRTEKEKLTTGAGIEALARRLCQRGKAVVLEDDLRKARVECRPHNRLLPQRHRGRHQDGTLTTASQRLRRLSYYLLLGETA